MSPLRCGRLLLSDDWEMASLVCVMLGYLIPLGTFQHGKQPPLASMLCQLVAGMFTFMPRYSLRLVNGGTTL